MLLPGAIIGVMYTFIPMIGGLIIAFQDYRPERGFFSSQWVGFGNFSFVLHMANSFRVLENTVIIAFLKIVALLIVPIIISLLLNEVSFRPLKRTVQTIIYFPYFLSWVIVAGILIDLLSPSTGPVGQIFISLGLKPIYFLGDPGWFRVTLVISEVWKTCGFNTVIFLAALTNIDPTLYEAAAVDGATRWDQTLHVTLPGMKSIVVLMAVLGMGNILNAGFEQVFNMYSPQVYSTGDILDTLIYRIGIVEAQYGVSTAVGLFRSVVSLLFIALSYKLADKLANYRIF
jgi:putative aldouronate transport system permease protein